MQVCMYLWSMQRCVLVSPGESVVSPCFQFLMIVEKIISHTLFLFGGCFCSLFIEFWGNIQLVQEQNLQSKEGKRPSQCKSCIIFLFLNSSMPQGFDIRT